MLTFSVIWPRWAICSTRVSTPLALSGFTRAILATATSMHSETAQWVTLKCAVASSPCRALPTERGSVRTSLPRLRLQHLRQHGTAPLLLLLLACMDACVHAGQ